MQTLPPEVKAEVIVGVKELAQLLATMDKEAVEKKAKKLANKLLRHIPEDNPREALGLLLDLCNTVDTLSTVELHLEERGRKS